MHKTANVVALIALIALSGCGRILVPYESEFMCALGDDYGKCSNVEDAYDSALGDSGSASSTSVLRCSEAQARLGLCVQTGVVCGRGRNDTRRVASIAEIQ